MTRIVEFCGDYIDMERVGAIVKCDNDIHIHLLGGNEPLYYIYSDERYKRVVKLWKGDSDLKQQLIEAGMAKWGVNPKNGKPMFELLKYRSYKQNDDTTELARKEV